jgi:histidinol-phosphatase (PHP family)
MKTCFHTHSNFSDGKVSVDQIIQAAIDHGFERVALTDHGPVPFPSAWNMPYDKISSYLSELDKAKEKFSNKITVLKGFEADYLPGLKQITFLRQFGVDVIVGSVHYVGKFPDGTAFNIDKSSDVFTRGLKEIYNDDIQRFARDYYTLVCQMLVEDKPDIVAHLTLLEKYNKRLGGIINTEEKWYRDLVKMSLHFIKISNSVMEINARSYYRGLADEFVPDLWTVKEARKLGIEITIDGDVHSPDDFGKYWQDAVDFVHAAGYDHVTIFGENGTRETIKI